MTKWMIIRQSFMSTAMIYRKGFLNEDEAINITNKLNDATRIDIEYHVQAYETDKVINLEDLNIKLKLI